MTALAQSWAIHVAHLLWQTSAATLFALFLIRLLRREPARLRHAIALIALMKFVIPPMLPLPTGIFSAAPPASQWTLARGIDARILIALMALHAIGIVVAFAKIASEAWRLRAIRRNARRADGYLLSDDIPVPLTTGSVILIPAALAASLSARGLRDVLAHEEQHIRNRDVLLNTLQSFVVALWWFDPFVRWLAAEARTLREERCDEMLLAGGTCERAHYARTLLSAATFASGRAPITAAAIAESPHSLLRRVRRIADARFAPSFRLGVAGALVILLFALTVLPGLRVSADNRVAFDHATRHALHH